MNAMLVLAAQAVGQGGPMPMVIMMVVIFIIIRFFMIHPQRKKQKEIRAFQNALSADDPVAAGGGAYDTVKRIDMTTNKIEVETTRSVVITVDRNCAFVDVQASQQGQSK